MSPDLSKKRREQLLARESRPPGLVVVSPVNEWSCSECDGTGDFLIMEEQGPVCLGCADMGHLIFLPSGDAALTRRAKKASCLSVSGVRSQTVRYISGVRSQTVRYLGRSYQIFLCGALTLSLRLTVEW